MKFHRFWLAILLIWIASAPEAALAARQHTFVGEVGDAMCGRRHVDSPAAECTRKCVDHGSKYALIVGDRAYVLEATDQATLDALHQLSGKIVTLTGSVENETIHVRSVSNK